MRNAQGDFHLVLSEDEQFVFRNQLHRVAVEVLSILEAGGNSVENSADVLAHGFVFRPCADLRVRHPGADAAGRRGRLCFVTSRHQRRIRVVTHENAVGSIGRLHDLLSGWEVTVPSVYLNTFQKVKRAHLSKKHSRTKNSRIPKVCYTGDVKKAGG